jgi:hypothetical protein
MACSKLGDFNFGVSRVGPPTLRRCSNSVNQAKFLPALSPNLRRPSDYKSNYTPSVVL